MKFTNFTKKPAKQPSPPVATETTTRRSSGFLSKPGAGVRSFINMAWTSFTFLILVVGFSLKVLLHALFSPNKRWTRPFSGLLRGYDGLYEKIVSVFDRRKAETASRSYFIELSFRNMQAKKTRTLVTVFGMAISIAFIVFLMSIGYGLQNLVTSRVARLEELQQTEVLPGLSEDQALNDDVMSRLQSMPNVKSVLPLISVVGRISYQDSITDVAVYGTTTEYLTSSAIQPIYGGVFESHDLSRVVGDANTSGSSQAQQAGASGTPYAGQELQQLSFSINQGSWLRVRSEASTQGSILGFAKRTEVSQTGMGVYGDYYSGYTGSDVTDENGEPLAVWIRSTFTLWQNVPCTTNETPEEGSTLQVHPDCEAGQYIPLREGGQQVEREGYVAQLSLQVLGGGSTAEPSVLGTSTLIAQAGDGGALPLVNISTSSAFVSDQQKTVVEVAEGSIREAVVNRAILSLLALPEDQAVGQTITLTFVAVGDLIEGEAQRIESAPTTYTIVGVTPEEGTPVVYVPFTELRSLGLNRFSQMKVIATDKNVLPEVRAAIESMGYGTVSVADTVAQIDSLFATFRLLLGVIGLVALAVAALGMFNTLTVSLLERTREVGLLKAMGMKSAEVRELFLTESMIMGFYGGVVGLILGMGAGKLLSLILSSVAIARGVGFIDVSVVPLTFVVVVVILAILVGVFTGYFPARRATRISALNALRYE